MIELTNNPINTAELLSGISSPRAGAVVLFLGTTRQFTAGRETASLDYECYAEMAERKLGELETEAYKRWPIEASAIVHRLGRVEIEEASVAVAVSSGHRQAAFEAAKWLIDSIKEIVPIWKKENWADGSSGWVHPGLGTPTTQEPAP